MKIEIQEKGLYNENADKSVKLNYNTDIVGVTPTTFAGVSFSLINEKQEEVQVQTKIIFTDGKEQNYVTHQFKTY